MYDNLARIVRPRLGGDAMLCYVYSVSIGMSVASLLSANVNVMGITSFVMGNCTF